MNNNNTNIILLVGLTLFAVLLQQIVAGEKAVCGAKGKCFNGFCVEAPVCTKSEDCGPNKRCDCNCVSTAANGSVSRAAIVPSPGSPCLGKEDCKTGEACFGGQCVQGTQCSGWDSKDCLGDERCVCDCYSIGG